MRLHNYLLLLLCTLVLNQLRAQEVSTNYFQDGPQQVISTTSTVGALSTFELTDCEELRISVTDPVNAPTARFGAYVVRVRDTTNAPIRDLTDRVTATLRVRSAEAMQIGILFRSGDGSSAFRTARLPFDVPAGLDAWTEATVDFTGDDLGGLDPTDIRDMWIYLDPGTENFPGNELYIDHIVIGGAPDPAQNSSCSLGGGMMSDTVATYYFQDETQNVISTTSTAGAVTTFELTDCEEIKLSITDPVNAPLARFNAYIVGLRDTAGNSFSNLTDRVTATMRVRSAEAMQVGILFRSGTGASDFRTARVPFDVPAGLDAWTEATVTIEGDDLGGLDPADIRDMWFYLDPGTENFPGNEFYIDHIAIGGDPDPAQNSPCELGGMMGDSFVDYFQADTLTSVNTTNRAARTSNIAINPTCESFIIFVNDLIDDPLPAFNAYQVEPTTSSGEDLTDITDNVNVTMRVRSLAEVNVSVLLRSGDGTMDFRTNRLDFDVPAGMEDWTEVTLEFGADDLAGFNPADLLDLWFYLDRGEVNFNGNLFEVDHVAIGTLPDAAFYSPCPNVMVDTNVFVDYFQADTLTSFTTTNTAGLVSTFAFDDECETVAISVTDPAAAVLPPFNAYQVNPTNANGDDVTDITGNMTVTMRVRSAAEVNVSFLFRSGGGTMEERTDRLDVDVPGGLSDWTEFTVTFTEAEMGGFNPADLRDLWFYLDRGEANFAGNFFVIDHIAVGTSPNPMQNSPCSLMAEPTEFVVQFADGNTSVLGGAESDKYTLTADDNCEEIKVEVTDPVGSPHQAFRPIVINPTNASGVPITNIEGQTEVFIRARSTENFPIAVVFRSGDGSVGFRTAPVEQTVVGDLTRWSNLRYTFSEEDLRDFDPTDLIDMWIYLDRENDNFPGNELYIDYIAIGEKPDSLDSSTCGLADIMTGTGEAAWGQSLRLFPNPTSGLLTLDVPGLTGNTTRLNARLLDVTGREVSAPFSRAGASRLDLDLTALPAGIYFLQLRDSAGRGVMRRVVKR